MSLATRCRAAVRSLIPATRFFSAATGEAAAAAAAKLDVTNIPLPSQDRSLLGKDAAKPSAATASLEADAMGEAAAAAPTGPRINPITGEVNGPRGPEPTRFGDYERNGRCYDF